MRKTTATLMMKHDEPKHVLLATIMTAVAGSKGTGWWFQPLCKILVSWDYYSQYIWKKCSKPPTSNMEHFRVAECLDVKTEIS